MKITEKNKNLDLRRWGKNQYTKALGSASGSGSGSDSGSDSGSSSGPLSSYEDFLVRIIYNTMELGAEDFDQAPAKTDWSEEWIRENVVLPDAIEMATFLTDVPQAGESENYTGYCRLLVPSDTELPMDVFIGNGTVNRPVYAKNTQINPDKWYMIYFVDEYATIIAPGAVLEEDDTFQNYYPAHFTDGVLQWAGNLANVYKEFALKDNG